MEPTVQLREIVPGIVRTFDGITADQLSAPTPCSDFTVSGVIDHMVVLGSQFAYLFRGEQPVPVAPPAATDEVPTELFHAVMDDLLGAVHSPGAMDRTIVAPVGEMPGDVFAKFLALDGLVHGWDLATSTGQPYDPPAEVVAAVASFAGGAISPEMRQAGMFGPPTTAPPDATPLERLVAFTGRSVPAAATAR
jgi:uncharacterized protein (TIGR03086 family)